MVESASAGPSPAESRFVHWSRIDAVDFVVRCRRGGQVEVLLGGGRKVRQWCRHEVECRCGRSTGAAYDVEQIPTSAFGPQLKTLAVTLEGVYHLSRRNTNGGDGQQGTEGSSEEAHAAFVEHPDATTWLTAASRCRYGRCARCRRRSPASSSMARATIESMFTDSGGGKQPGIMVRDRASVLRPCFGASPRRSSVFGASEGRACSTTSATAFGPTSRACSRPRSLVGLLRQGLGLQAAGVQARAVDLEPSPQRLPTTPQRPPRSPQQRNEPPAPEWFVRSRRNVPSRYSSASSTQTRVSTRNSGC